MKTPGAFLQIPDEFKLDIFTAKSFGEVTNKGGFERMDAAASKPLHE